MISNLVDAYCFSILFGINLLPHRESTLHCFASLSKRRGFELSSLTWAKRGPWIADPTPDLRCGCVDFQLAEGTDGNDQQDFSTTSLRVDPIRATRTVKT